MIGRLAMRLVTASVGPFFLAASVAAQPLPLTTPESVGMSSKRLAAVRQVIQADVDQGLTPGAVVAVARRGKLVYYEAIGFLDKTTKTPMRKEAVFNLASMTKPLVAAGALTLIEEGRLLLNAPVSAYLPELNELRAGVIAKEANGTESVVTQPLTRKPTIQDLMRHTEGMALRTGAGNVLSRQYPNSTGLGSPYNMSGPELLGKLSTLPLQYQPGSRWEYGFGFDVLGLVIESITKVPLGEYLQTAVFKPVRMTDTSFALRPEDLRRHAKPLPIDPLTNRPQAFTERGPIRFDCGGACALSSAADYLRFAQMLLNLGQLDGTRVLGRKTVEYMTADQLGPEVNIESLRAYPLINGYGFGLGVAVRRSTGVAGIMGSSGDYHWPGGSGTYFWVDPKEELAVVFMSATPGESRLRYRQLATTLILQAIVD